MDQQALKKLEKQIDDLKTFSQTNGIDIHQEIEKLSHKAATIASELTKTQEPMGAWDRVQLSRNSQRPTTTDYIKEIFDNFMEMHGDRLFADDPAIVGGIATLDGIPVTIVGNQKGKNTKENIHRRFGMSQPEGYRKALRIMQQANKFNRPIITFINTAGAFPGKEAEERGQSEAIARNLREMAGFDVPIISFIIGEGGSGGALALGISNKLMMLENTFYSVISPEGAAALLWKDASKAKQASEALKVTPEDLYKLGIVDDIVKEPAGGAHTDLKTQALYIKHAIKHSLRELIPLEPNQLKDQRFNKFRSIGEFEESVDIPDKFTRIRQ